MITRETNTALWMIATLMSDVVSGFSPITTILGVMVLVSLVRWVIRK